MATYLDTAKIQTAGRLSLSPSVLRNLQVSAGDSVEIFFDEALGGLLILPVKSQRPTSNSVEGESIGAKRKDR